jgi:hypothetical protein
VKKQYRKECEGNSEMLDACPKHEELKENEKVFITFTI